VENLRRIKYNDNIGYAPCHIRPIKSKIGSDNWQEIDNIDNQKEEEIRVFYNYLCNKFDKEIGDFSTVFRDNSNVSISDM
jgi:hypothetical protein